MERHRPHLSPARPLVLLIEGQADMRALYSLGLLAMGFDVVAPHDGPDAYRRASETHPDVIVTDLTMPDFDAWQFLHDLKSNSDTRDIPVVAVAGDVQQSTCERVARDGFAAFFPKCSLPDALASGLRRILTLGRLDPQPYG